MGLEHFPINEDLLYKFIEANKKTFLPKKAKNKGGILINYSMVRMQIPWIMPKVLLAKGLEEKTDSSPVAVTWNRNDKLTDFFESYGVKHLSLNEECKKNIFGLIYAFYKTVCFVLFDGTGDGLKSLKMQGIKVGNNLYEDILRTSPLSTLRTCKNKVVIKKIVHLIWASHTLVRICKKYKIDFAITDDMAYHEGLFIKLFKKNGIRVIAGSNKSEKEVRLFKDGEVIRHNYVDVDDVRKEIQKYSFAQIDWVDKYLEERFKGNNGREIDRQAFSGKRVLSKEELVEQFGIDPNKKTVVIMAHTFTDAVFNYGDYYFRDYYDWTKKTLQLAANNSNCNWVLKPHPTRSSYNESADSIEMMFDRYKKDNMFFLSDDISSESIKNIADVLITIGGNAGAEYACFGIPAIIVGKPYYRGQGYTIEPSTYQEYEKYLLEIENINHLDKKQIENAKKVFYFKNSHANSKNIFSDDFSCLLNKKYDDMISKMSLSYFKNNEGTEYYNDRALEAVIEYMSNNDIKETEYYCRGRDKIVD